VRKGWLLGFVALAACRAVPSGPLEVGVAVREITPPLGYAMRGYYSPRGATGVLDPLRAKAVVFRQGPTQAALVELDVCGIAPELTAQVRRRVGAIPPEHVVLAATHSHTGPEYADAIRRFAESGADDGYVARLVEQTAGAIADAQAAAAPALLKAGTARQPVEISFNRRFVLKDGSIRTWATFKDPDVVRPAGPIDPEVGIILIESSRAALVNFALHLDTVGGTQYSADYPHALEEGLKPDVAVTIFAAGCCGDINHVDPRGSPRRRAPEIGGALARTVREALPGLAELSAPSLAVRRAVVRAPLQTFSEADLTWAREIVARDGRGEKLPFLDEVRAYKLLELEALRRAGAEMPLEVHAIRLDREAAIVTLPGEVFVELGLAIKKRSPFPTTLVVELANTDATNYIPTREQYPGGHYEVTNSVLAAGGGEMLVEAAVGLLRALRE
jgi:hypothetical protein